MVKESLSKYFIIGFGFEKVRADQRPLFLNTFFRIVNLQRVLQSESILARFLPAALREKKAYQNKTSFIEDLLEPQSTSAPNFLMCERQSIDDEMDPLIPIDKKLEHKLRKFLVFYHKE